MGSTVANNGRQDGARTAVLYARVSSDEQEKEGYSIPAQTKLLQQYAGREGFQVVHEYVDVESAKQPGRTGFDQMVAFFEAEQNKPEDRRCRVLLVEKTDRLYRNLKDYITIDELKIDIHLVKEGEVLSPTSHSSQKFIHGIKLLMAKQYVDNLSEEVKKGLREKAEQGLPPNRVPLGYRYVEGADGKRIVVVDESVAPAVRRMFERYATGDFAVVQVCEMAKAEGLFAGREDDKVVTSVYAVLRNPFYYGEFLFKEKLYPGSYTPLITKQLWDRVQRTLTERGTRKPRRVVHDFAFSGLIRCGHCGSALTGQIQKKKFVYYHCTSYRGKCGEPYVREEVLEGHFTDILRGISFDSEVLAWVTDALRQSHVDEQKFHNEAIDRLQAEYKRLQQRIDRMYIDKLDGKVDGAFFEGKAGEWRAEQASIRQSIADHEHGNKCYLDEGVALLELASRAADLFEKQPAREKRRLLNFVLSNCTWANGALTPTYRQPFDMIADAVGMAANEKAAGGVSDGLHSSKLPELDLNQ